ncbi:hypothetical protein ACFXEB_06880 [Aerococcus urinaeequi]|uniref:hypothetical protein n=1 Tax=Aerococcus urinaeequi TaxID=51665 RepID=UPI003670B585
MDENFKILRYELLELISDFQDATTLAYKNLLDSSDKKSLTNLHHLNNAYANFVGFKNFLHSQPNMQHYELSSLITMWENLYGEMLEVFNDNDSNTSWMYSRFETTNQQFESVKEFLVPQD